MATVKYCQLKQTACNYDVLKARKQCRRGLVAKLRERTKAVEQLLDIKRHDSAESVERSATDRNEKKATGPWLKRYLNE
jgi:hypothetical protein